MKVTSAFAQGEAIPRCYTCQEDDLSPPIQWAGLPPETRSLALIIDDPDAPNPRSPRMTWVHWVLYNIPHHLGGLRAGADGAALPLGTLQGTNSWRQTGYGGPCPPVGRHRYFFKLFALDRLLPDLALPTADTLEKAMRGHVIGRAELMGTYEKT